MRALGYFSVGMLLAASVASAQSAVEHIALGDKEYVAMNAPAALAHYQEAMKADPNSYEAHWKASRSAVDLGTAERNDEKRELDFKNGEQYAPIGWSGSGCRAGMMLNSHPQSIGESLNLTFTYSLFRP